MNTKHVSPEKIMQIAIGHWSLKALAVAVDLSIFTSLKGQEFTAKQLGELIGVPLRSLERLLDANAALGFLDKSGDMKWIRVHGKVVLEDGTPAGLRGVITDITKQKKAEEEHSKSESRFHEIIENMDVGYMENDLAGNITYANRLTYERLGYTREEYIGSNYNRSC